MRPKARDFHQSPQTITRSLVEVLKSSRAKGLSSVQGELTRLETEDRELDRRLAQLAKRQKP